MDTSFYRFQVGQFECSSLLDGHFEHALKDMYVNAPADKVESALRIRRQPVDPIVTPYNFLYVNTGDHRVLVDMGIGQARNGHLVDSLRAAGVQPEEIDTVIISHAHPDHIGGTLDDQGRLNYPNAQYFINQVEWDFWFSDQAEQIASELFINFARANLTPLGERITFLRGESEVLPGILFTPAPGHTPGHGTVTFRSGGEQVIYTADTALQPLHLEHPTWRPVFDLLPDDAFRSKQRVFDQLAHEGTLMLGQHFPPVPGLGYVSKQQQGWRFEPVTIKNTENEAIERGG